MAQERTGVITMKGNPKTLVGPALKAGDKRRTATLRKGTLVFRSDPQAKTMRGTVTVT